MSLTIPSFNDSRERTIWVQSRLRLIGSSFAAIALQLGCRRSAVAQAMYLPSDSMERAIAQEIGVTQEALFPERYDTEGRRLHPVKNKTIRHGRNVKTGEAA
jgi:lambda repressor-like predicted transcriptional regulator